MSLLSLVLLMSTLTIDGKGDVIDRTKDNYMGLKRPMIVAYYEYQSKSTSNLNKYWRNRMQIVSNDHKDISFAVSDVDQFRQQLADYGLEFDWETTLQSQPIVIAEDSDEVLYVLDRKLQTDSLREFVDKFKTKDLIPHIKSESIPLNSDNVVKEVVGKTFNELVVDNEKDVLLLMYAQWCGHSREALPIWQKLAKEMTNKLNVDILQMEATKNWSPKPYKTHRYPTIYWLSSLNKLEPQVYTGERSVRQLIQYIAHMSSKPLTTYDRNGDLIAIHKPEL